MELGRQNPPVADITFHNEELTISRKLLMTIILKEFPHHVLVSRVSKTTGKPRYAKITGQNSWTPFTKGKIYDTLKEYAILAIRKSKIKFTPFTVPVGLMFEFHTLPYHGHIKIRNNKVYITKSLNWDLDNSFSIWLKILQDVLQKVNILANDDITKVRHTGEVTFKKVMNLEDRKIVIKIFTK